MIISSLSGSAAAEAGADPAADVAAGVRDTLEDVFAAAGHIRDRTAALAARGEAGGRALTTADLTELHPVLRSLLKRHQQLVSGAGFVAEPGLLGDAHAWLEWWQTGPGGTVRPLLLDLDPGSSAYSDYTHWEWFALPRATGRRAVSGPFVDYLCSDEYSLTLTVPVYAGSRFLGVAGADVYLRHFEAAVTPLLRRLAGPACLVNARGRVAASTDKRQLAGSLLKGPDFAAVSSGPQEGAEHGGLHLRPCSGIPLVLVTRTT